MERFEGLILTLLIILVIVILIVLLLLILLPRGKTITQEPPVGERLLVSQLEELESLVRSIGSGFISKRENLAKFLEHTGRMWELKDKHGTVIDGSKKTMTNSEGIQFSLGDHVIRVGECATQCNTCCSQNSDGNCTDWEYRC
jgi:hypothetical protein